MSRVWFETLSEIVAERDPFVRRQTARNALEDIGGARRRSVMAGMLYCTADQSRALDPASSDMRVDDSLVQRLLFSGPQRNVGRNMVGHVLCTRIAKAGQSGDLASFGGTTEFASRFQRVFNFWEARVEGAPVYFRDEMITPPLSSPETIAYSLAGQAARFCAYALENDFIIQPADARDRILTSIARDGHSYLKNIAYKAMDDARERSGTSEKLLHRFTIDSGDIAIDYLDELSIIAPITVTNILHAICMPAYLDAVPNWNLNHEEAVHALPRLLAAPMTIGPGSGRTGEGSSSAADQGGGGSGSDGGRGGSGGGDGGSDGDPSHSRVIDAKLHCSQFEVQQRAFLYVVLRVEGSKTVGQWQGRAQLVSSPVFIRLEAEGFQLLSDLPPPINLPPGKDSAPTAFELKITSVERPWLHIFLVQDGKQVGELLINDFSSLTGSDPNKTASAPFRPISEPDLSLIVRSGEDKFLATSPRDKGKYNFCSLEKFSYPKEPVRKLLKDNLRSLYDPSSNAEETERDLKLVGKVLAAGLPKELVELLQRQDIKLIMLRHDAAFDFPLELCYIDQPGEGRTIEPFFVGDKMAVCRWYIGNRNLPDVYAKDVRKAAFLKGTTSAIDADEKLLQKIFSTRAITFCTCAEVRLHVFKTDDFDLIHFTGHCVAPEEEEAVLELHDGSYIKLGSPVETVGGSG